MSWHVLLCLKFCEVVAMALWLLYNLLTECSVAVECTYTLW